MIMKLTNKKARALLDEARQKSHHTHWVQHSLGVGFCAGKIAQALKERGHKVDPDLAAALGTIHDIGKYNNEYIDHPIRGYAYLRQRGYDAEYCNVCLTHSYLNRDLACTASTSVASEKYHALLRKFLRTHQPTLEEEIINLCDLLVPPSGLAVTVDQRLVDLITRWGTWENTQYHVIEAQKLKARFDAMLGQNLYNLFPDIKERL